jgi:orotidine-5'-phosphate decarboxylase
MAELVLALDVPSRSEALRLLDRLPSLRWIKVGSILMTAEGPELIRELVGRGLSVFLDLKWHDIPSTVAGAVAVAGNLGVRMATVHTAGGLEMLRAAQSAAVSPLSLVGVTVLTSDRQPAAPLSMAPADADDGIATEVVRLAQLARQAGLSGVVCSALEVERVRAAMGPASLIVVPGIRRAGDAAGDQRRIGTPAEAVRRGATHLVVGRPILRADDPGRALATFSAELEGIS